MRALLLALALLAYSGDGDRPSECDGDMDCEEMYGVEFDSNARG